MGAAGPRVGSGDRPTTLNSLATLRSLVPFFATMLDGREEDDILRLAESAVGTVGSCRVEAVYLLRDERLVPWMVSPRRLRRELTSQVRELHGVDGPVHLQPDRWGRALTLRHHGGHLGYLVVGAGTEPCDEEIFLLELLAQQTGVALANATRRRWERRQAVDLLRRGRESAAVNERLAKAVSDLERERSIRDTFSDVSASGEGEEGIARVLHALTGLPSAVEDRFGNLRAWAGPGRPTRYPKINEIRREQVLGEAARRGRPVRDKDRLVALARIHGDVLGVLVLVDPGRKAGRHDVFALDCAADTLAIELAHRRNLAEVELRLRRDLVDDLIAGTDEDSAQERSITVGHDLHGAHHVVVARWRGEGRREVPGESRGEVPGEVTDESLMRAAERAAAELGATSLASRRSGMAVLLVRGRLDWTALRRAVADQVRSGRVAIGVGGRCDCPAEFPRSFQEAVRALEIRMRSRSPDGVTSFDELGLFRIMDTGDGGAKIMPFVREWLGGLLDYDARHHSELVRTLSRYLDCGGNYDTAAAALVIHRSTLRYRLQRIREVGGHDLTDAETRLNLHVATKALQVLEGES